MEEYLENCEFEIAITPEKVDITSSIDRLDQFIEAVKASYVSKPVTTGNVKEAKQSLASVRALGKTVTDKMASVKKEILRPWDDLNAKVKAILAKLGPVEADIAAGVDAVVQAEKEAKHQAVVDLIAAECARLPAEVALVIKDYFDPRWENKTVSDKEIVKDFQRLADAAGATVSAIKGNPHEAQLLGVFKEHYSYSEVAMAISRYAAEDARMAEIEEARILQAQKDSQEREVRRQREDQEAKARAEAAAEAAANAEPAEPVRQPGIMDTGVILTCTFVCCGTKEDIARLVNYGKGIGVLLRRTSKVEIASQEAIDSCKEAR